VAKSGGKSSRPSGKPKAKAKTKAKTKSTGSRGVGRPARLSREAILTASIELLESESAEAFTLARVARKLDTVSMALYNYFPSREALLNAVADDVCMRFEMPKIRSGQPWQKKLRAWLNAVRSLVEQRPVVLQVLGVDGQTTAGWLRVSLHVSRTLHDEGMRGKELALNSYLFCSQVVALLMFEHIGATFHSALSLSHIEELETDEQDFLLALRPYHTQLSSNDVLEEGFNQIIRALEAKLGAAG
jgi:AcrR family transcriptional regulator|tara:strand:- start:4961 stop:5695 length:735 start_codon:yes stop_codon:yes gene_type:complete